MIIPFIPLYINELGDFTTVQLTFWSGAVFSVTFLAMAVVSPWWGRLADRYGRKPMLLRASLGMGIVIFLTGFAVNVYQLLVLRLILGLLSGFKSNAIALMAVAAPKDKAGQVLGTLSTGSVAGTLIGPLLGGVVAEFFGYRPAFFISGTVLFLVFLLSLTQVREVFVPQVVQAEKDKHFSFFRQLKNPRIIVAMLLTTMIIQTTNTSINPILTLFVKQIMNHEGNIAITTGVIAALPGLSALVAAPLFGRLGDRIGNQKILIAGLCFSILVYVPMAFATQIWQLAILRFFVGIADAALLPSVQALLSKNSPDECTGRIFSYNQTAQSSGNVLGPLVGSSVSGMLGFPAVFIATSIFALVNLGIVKKLGNKQ
jgi:DHA1 family multidrug resistance protein-like MFS transporter